MIRALILPICALLTAGVVQAQPKWIHLRSDHFDMYSSANEHDSRETVNYLEQVRSFFVTFMGAPPADEVPVYVVQFGSAKEYEPYKPNEFAAAFFLGTADRDYVVLGKTGEGAARTIVHEYVHLIEKHAHMNLPPWLSEGLAELFSTLTVLGNNIELADPIPAHLHQLQTDRWVPLATILAAGQDSPYYNETQKATSLYSEGWALTHLLATTPKYRPGFAAVTAAITKGTPSVEALEKTYDMPLAKIEAELQLYVVAGSFTHLVTKTTLDVSQKKWAFEPAKPFDVHLVEANLFDKTATLPEAKKRLQALLQEDATRPEPWASLAYISWREGDTKTTLERFNKAYTLGDHSAKLLWDYGRLAESSRPEEADRALGDLIASEPDNTDARIELAAVRYNRKLYPQVLEALKGLKTASPEQAPRLFSLMANAQLQTGDYAEARKSAERWNSFAKTDQDRARIAQLLQYLNQREGSGTSPGGLDRPSFTNSREAASERNPTLERRASLDSASLDVDPQEQAIEAAIRAANGGRDPEARPTLKTKDEDPDAPVLIRIPPPEPTPATPVIPVLSMSGMLIEAGCGSPATLVLRTDEGRKTFLVLAPSNTVVTGTAPSLPCGALTKGIPMKIDYALPPAGSKADGTVKALHFPE